MNQSLIGLIAQNKLSEARTQIVEQLNLIRDQYCVRVKSVIGDTIGMTESADIMTEADVMKRGRTMLIRRRIRKGKLQRNIRKSAVKGFTLKKGKLTRIPAQQRLKMRMKARRAAIKRRAKLQQALRKRKISLRKRKSMGIK